MTFVTATLPFLIEKKQKKPSYAVIQDIADSFEPKLRKAVLEAIAAAQGGIVLAEVIRALEKGDIGAAEAAIPWDAVTGDQLQTEVTRVLRDTMEQSGIAAEDLLPASIAARFDVVNPRAVEWARSESASLVTQVSDDTKTAIRGIITRAFEEGMSPYQSARLIRSEIGLPDLLARAVERYRAAQLEATTKEKAMARAERYAKKLLNYRAKLIARQETLKASNMGQQELWRQARDNGLLESNVYRKFVVTNDERVCDICEPLDGTIVGIEQNFTGFRRNAAGQIAEVYSELVPPIHISCRCTVVLEFGE